MLPTPIYDGPDWHSPHIPMWQHMLADLVGKPCVRALEIGSYEGRSSRWLLDNVLTDPTASLSCIDTFDDPVRLNRFEYNTGIVGIRVHPRGANYGTLGAYAGSSAKWLRVLWALHFDFIYIDGSHEAPDVLSDAVLSFEMLRSGGLLCFDDYGWDPGGMDGGVHAPKLAIDAFCTVNRERLKVLFAGVQVWIEKL